MCNICSQKPQSSNLKSLFDHVTSTEALLVALTLEAEVFVSVREIVSIKFAFFVQCPSAKIMAANRTVHGAPPPLSAKVVGYVDS